MIPKYQPVFFFFQSQPYYKMPFVKKTLLESVTLVSQDSVFGIPVIYKKLSDSKW